MAYTAGRNQLVRFLFRAPGKTLSEAADLHFSEVAYLQHRVQHQLMLTMHAVAELFLRNCLATLYTTTRHTGFHTSFVTRIPRRFTLYKMLY